MSLFKRSVINEISSHAGVVFSTLVVVWLSVLLVRLLGEAAGGAIGADVVMGLAAFSTITALPTILAVSLFIAVLTTVTRNYRESEMVVWFASGLSLSDWVRPVLLLAVPTAVLVAVITLSASPWAYRQINEYRQRFEQRSDLSRISSGNFIESNNGNRVFFGDEPLQQTDEIGRAFVRIIDPQWHTLVTTESAHIETEPNGDRFIVMTEGRRYDFKFGTPEMRLIDFDRYGVRIERRAGRDARLEARRAAESSSKGRPSMLLIADEGTGSWGQLMWRIAMPLATLNLALLAVPLGAVNPRLGRTGDLLLAGLIALLYMNLINLSRSWIGNGAVDFGIGVWAIHAIVMVMTIYLFWHKLRIRAPKNAAQV
jgi:lipopolysaccharide export system permease protein